MDFAAVGLRPVNTAMFEPPGEQTEPVLGCPKDLDRAAAAASNHENIAASGFSSSAVCTFAQNP
jgi:hypothetical protein